MPNSWHSTETDFIRLLSYVIVKYNKIASIPILRASALSDANIFAEQASEMMDRNRFDYGKDLAEKTIEVDPTFPRGFVCLGRAMIGLNRPDLAIKSLRTALEYSPQNLDALYFMAFAHRRLHKFKEALEYIDDCLRIVPDSAVVLVERGHCLQSLERSDEAKQCFFKAREIEPNDESVQNAIGVWHLKAGQYIEAEHAFRVGLRIKSNHAAMLNNLGVALENQNNLKDAAIAFKSALLADPSLDLAKTNTKLSVDKFVRGQSVGLGLTFLILAQTGIFVVSMKKFEDGQLSLLALCLPIAVLIAIVLIYSQYIHRKRQNELTDVDPELLEIYNKIQNKNKLNRQLNK